MSRVVAGIAVCIALSFSTARAEDAKALFPQKCAACHGPDGKGQTAMGKKLGAPDLTKISLSEDAVDQVITNGKPPKMMAYKGKLTPEQIRSLAKLVKAGLK